MPEEQEQPERQCAAEVTPQAASPGSALPPLPERPDDVLNRLDLDAATIATLETAARDVLQAEGVKPFLQTTPVLHSYMVTLWCQQQALLHTEMVVGAGVLDPEAARAA